MTAVSDTLNKVAAAVRAHADELTALDQAIGDGDHGVNMRRGFDALDELSSEIASMPAGKALQKAGMTLVMKVGGASGPLYGSLLMGIGKALPDKPGALDFAGALQAGVDSVRQRGKAEVGDKTMLDVLVPVCNALRDGVDRSMDNVQLLDSIVDVAGRSLESTRDMQARKGRASYLGERSVGHLDPGARSSQLIIETVCAGLRGES